MLPITIKAGIICEDGWESSCDFPGPGCCSHHGGVAGNDEYYDNSSSSDVKPVGAWFYILIFFVIPIIYSIREKQKEKQKERYKEELEEYYKNLLSKKWRKYLKEKEDGTGLYELEKGLTKNEKKRFLQEEQEKCYKKINHYVSEYNWAINIIKNKDDSDFGDYEKSQKQRAINSYDKIFDYIFMLCVLNDRLKDLDKTNNYLSFTRYKNQLFNEFSVFDELLSKYRS